MVEKRGYGTGQITLRGGRWRARYRLAGKTRSLGTYASKEDAEQALADLLARLAESPREVVGDTLRAFRLDWLEARRKDGHHRDVDSDTHVSQSWARAPIGELSLALVTSRDVRVMVDAWVAAADCERQTVCNRLNSLRQCLEYACRRGKIDANPAVGVRVPKMHRRKSGDVWTWLTLDELARVLGIADDEVTDCTAFAAYSGMREGEQAGLRWGDVDLDTGVAVVSKGWPGTLATKAGRTRRAVLLAPALDALERQRERRRGGLYVWPRPDGRPHTESSFRRHVVDVFRGRCKAAGIARTVRWHDLRHTCASHLVQGSWVPQYVRAPMSIAELATWIGHGKQSCTERYAHMCPDAVSGMVVRRQKPQALRDVRR